MCVRGVPRCEIHERADAVIDGPPLCEDVNTRQGRARQGKAGNDRARQGKAGKRTSR